MATYMKKINFEGMAKWMELQAKEELVHMSKIHTFIFDRDQNAELFKIPYLPKLTFNLYEGFRASGNLFTEIIVPIRISSSFNKELSNI